MKFEAKVFRKKSRFNSFVPVNTQEIVYDFVKVVAFRSKYLRNAYST